MTRSLRVVAGKDRAATLKELIAVSGVPLLRSRSEQTQPKTPSRLPSLLRWSSRLGRWIIPARADRGHPVKLWTV
jgi:hypothetical protein